MNLIVEILLCWCVFVVIQLFVRGLCALYGLFLVNVIAIYGCARDFLWNIRLLF